MYLGAVRLGTGAVLPLAPLSLPYSPEFEPRIDSKEGHKTLSQVARVTGGIERTVWDDVFDASRLRNRQIRDLVIPLALMVLLLHVGGNRRTAIAAVCGGARLAANGQAAAMVRMAGEAIAGDRRLRRPRHRLPRRPTICRVPRRQRLRRRSRSTSALSRAKAKSRDRLAR